ncbi:MAG: 3,4-dehydroadipyl-CoA semialdehyde dehydrogenase [Planctomycetes bacterium]|nr:3,4-dehydroadipyl-CoA semialdehyde dehydrogenase [Planctomycetota bacterium]
MLTLTSYTCGAFQAGKGDLVPLLNPATEEVVAQASCGGVDLAATLRFAREQGGPALRALTFAQRGELLGKLAAVIADQRDALIETSVANGGTTRGGGKFDIDGAAGTLQAYAELGKKLGDARELADGETVMIGRGAKLAGRHLWSAREGVAVFINAFNFPAWGFAEKAATALLAGMPVINKPATATAWTAAKLCELLVAANVLPAGAFQQLLGGVTPLLEALGPQDVVAFTGSSGTGTTVRSLPALLKHGVRVNVEADSLNAAVVGGGVEPGSSAWQTLLRDVVREMTEKSGQKCTATRRVIVPEALVAPLLEELSDRLGAVRVGNPANREVEVGPLATRQQRDDVHAGCARMRKHAEVAFGVERPEKLIDVPAGKGFFCGPMVFVARGETAVAEAHRDEIFGPVTTVVPYSGAAADAIALVRRGGGMLVTTVFSDEREWGAQVAKGIAPWVGRVCLVDSKSEGITLPAGMVLPDLIHGGPGRAGGGEELGGIRGVQHYLARTAFEGPRALVERLLG